MPCGFVSRVRLSDFISEAWANADTGVCASRFGNPTRYKHPSGKTLLIYLGDRWNGHGENGGVGNASYVWLPIISRGPNVFSIPGLANDNGNGQWKISDYAY